MKQIIREEDILLDILDGTINWDDLIKDYTLPMELIEKYIDKFDPFFLSKFANLTQEMIDKYVDLLQIRPICKYQKLSDEFIIKHIDDLHVVDLLIYQNLSDDIVEVVERKVPNAKSVILYKKMYNKMLDLIEDTKNNIEKVNSTTYRRVEERMQRDIIIKLKTIVRKMK